MKRKLTILFVTFAIMMLFSGYVLTLEGYAKTDNVVKSDEEKGNPCEGNSGNGDPSGQTPGNSQNDNNNNNGNDNQGQGTPCEDKTKDNDEGTGDETGGTGDETGGTGETETGVDETNPQTSTDGKDENGTTVDGTTEDNENGTTVEENDTTGNNDNNSTDDNANAVVTVTGGEIPKTATPWYNLFLASSVLTFASGGALFRYSRAN